MISPFRRYARPLTATFIAIVAFIAAGIIGPTSAQAVVCPVLNAVTHIPNVIPQRDVNWAGCNLSGADLSNAYLESANLTGAILFRANLSEANLFDANLTNADLRQATLRGAHFGGTNITNTDFTGAAFAGLRTGERWWSSIVGTTDTLPTNWKRVGNYLMGPGVDLRGAHFGAWDVTDFSSVDFTGANLSGVSFQGWEWSTINMAGVNLSGADLSNAGFDYVNLAGADLTNTNLTNTRFRGTDLTGTELAGSTMFGTSGSLITGRPAHLPDPWIVTGGLLVGPRASLRGLDLTGLDLRGADLTGSDIVSANLTDANLDDVPLAGANFTSAVLTRASFNNADLTGAVFTSAHLADADFTGATMTGVVSGMVTGTGATLPDPWKLRVGYLLGPQVNLHDVNFSGADLSNTTLDGANLTGAIFSRADLTHASLAGANLTAARFVGSTLSGTDFTDATMMRVRSEGINVPTPPTLPMGWRILNNYLVGAGAALTGADLSGVDFGNTDLTAAVLSYADLTNAVLAGTTLAGVSSGGITTVPTSLPEGWTIGYGWLLGPHADLTDADFTDGDLVGVNLTRANLTRTNFTRANLTRAILARNTTVGTIWTAATCPSGALAKAHVGRTCLGAAASAPMVVRTMRASFPTTHRATITWAAPRLNGNSPLKRYEFCRTACGQTRSWVSTGLARTFTLNSLAKGKVYVIHVRAVNAIGTSATTRLVFTQSK